MSGESMQAMFPWCLGAILGAIGGMLPGDAGLLALAGMVETIWLPGFRQLLLAPFACL